MDAAGFVGYVPPISIVPIPNVSHLRFVRRTVMEKTVGTMAVVAAADHVETASPVRMENVRSRFVYRTVRDAAADQMVVAALAVIVPGRRPVMKPADCVCHGA